MDPKVREAKLGEEEACGLYPFNGRDLPTELEELHVCVAMVEEECVAKAEELVALVIEASNGLMDLRMLPIQEVP
jgi:hypothetical protein